MSYKVYARMIRLSNVWEIRLVSVQCVCSLRPDKIDNDPGSWRWPAPIGIATLAHRSWKNSLFLPDFQEPISGMCQ